MMIPAVQDEGGAASGEGVREGAAGPSVAPGMRIAGLVVMCVLLLACSDSWAGPESGPARAVVSSSAACRRELVRACAKRLPRDAGLVELPLHAARPQADLKPAAGEDVRGRDLPGEQRRIPERHVDHQRAEPQPLGRGGRRDHRLERGRPAMA